MSNSSSPGLLGTGAYFEDMVMGVKFSKISMCCVVLETKGKSDLYQKRFFSVMEPLASNHLRKRPGEAIVALKACSKNEDFAAAEKMFKTRH